MKTLINNVNVIFKGDFVDKYSSSPLEKPLMAIIVNYSNIFVWSINCVLSWVNDGDSHLRLSIHNSIGK